MNFRTNVRRIKSLKPSKLAVYRTKSFFILNELICRIEVRTIRYGFLVLNNAFPSGSNLPTYFSNEVFSTTTYCF